MIDGLPRARPPAWLDRQGRLIQKSSWQARAAARRVAWQLRLELGPAEAAASPAHLTNMTHATGSDQGQVTPLRLAVGRQLGGQLGEERVAELSRQFAVKPR